MKAFVGISINSPYFSQDNLMNYIKYINGINNLNISDFAFLIGDTPYSITYSVLNKISISKSYRIVKNKGTDFVNLIKKFLEFETNLSFNTKIFTWEDITNCDFYNDLYEKTLKLYNENDDFRLQIKKQVQYNLKDRLANKNINDFELTLLDYYVIDEIAGLLTMSEYFDYKYEIYPGSDLFVLEKIISHDFQILENYKREFINLKFE